MPSNSTDTESWVANVQRPNNGELADAASLSQGFNPITQRSRWLYNRTRSNVFDVTRAPYNADRSGVTDSTSAIQDALDDASVAGGTVYLPGGTYRLNTGLTLYPGIHVFGDPDRAALIINHATDHVFTVSGISNDVAGLIENIAFAGLVANSGNVFHNPSGNAVVFKVVNCSMNSANLQGRFFFSESDSTWTFEDCRVYTKGAGANSDGYRQNSTNGFLTIRGGYIDLADGLSSAIYVGGGTSFVHNARIWAQGGTGGQTVIALLSVGRTHIFTDNRVQSNTNTKTGLAIGTGARIIARANDFVGFSAATVAGGAIAGVAGDGSIIEGDALPLRIVDSVNAYTPDVTRCAQYIKSSGTAPTITMPNPKAPNQEFVLTIMNNSGLTWAGVAFSGSALGADVGSTPTGTAWMWRLRAISPKADGNYVWASDAPNAHFTVP